MLGKGLVYHELKNYHLFQCSLIKFQLFCINGIKFSFKSGSKHLLYRADGVGSIHAADWDCTAWIGAKTLL